ncbi:MAG TPA: RtcB family protein [Polyangiaceae bacterium]|jgi:release factor H-coupled RctB family protein|nr:RtcB family protein [Polyangiaceae bacterium]
MITADSTPLPPHARLIARPDVWMEGDAIVQFARVAAYEGCVRAVAMPDLHAGRGIPLGAAFAFDNRVVPQLIGGDAGCGVRVVVTSASRMSVDTIERRARAAMEEDVIEGCDKAELFEAVWRGGTRALAEVSGIDGSIARLAAEEPEVVVRPSGDPAPFRAGFEEALGTAGGGNHFVEIARVAEVRDEAAAAALGIARNSLCVVAHTGSRGLGGALARRWGDATLSGEAMEKYLGELAGACRFARANRFLLAHRMLRALGCARASTLTGGFDVTHNDVALEPLAGGEAWVHRKGAAPARGSDLTIVLGSRGAPSWILRSKDCEEGLRSVAHGAGRRMGRSEALAKLKSKYKRAEVTRTALGGRVVCADPSLLFEEHPDAYKPIEPVVESLVEANLADPVAALIPVVTVKQ